MKCSQCQGAEATRKVRIGRIRYPLCGGCALKLDIPHRVTETVRGLAELYETRRRTQKLWERA